MLDRDARGGHRHGTTGPLPGGGGGGGTPQIHSPRHKIRRCGHPARAAALGRISSMSKKSLPKLIIASSQHDADALYATQFFVPDAFIYVQHRGRSTAVLSDLEVDRG